MFKYIVFMLSMSIAVLAQTHSFTTIIPTQKRALNLNEQIFVHINPSALQKDNTLSIHLPENLIVDFENSDYKFRTDGDFSWLGKPNNGALDEFSIFTTKSGATYGIIKYQGKKYILKKTDGDVYSITYKKEPKRTGIDFIVPPKPKLIETVPKQKFLNKTRTAKTLSRAVLRSTTSYVDVMILYTQTYANDAGASLNAQIQLSIDYANLAMSNSQIDFVYRLDHQELYENAGSNEDVTIGTSLDYLTNDDAVKVLRAEQGSDLVSLFRFNNVGGTVGLGWVAQSLSRPQMRKYSFNVSEFSELTFAHEAGHNLGCGHDYIQGCSAVIHSDACGHINNNFGTIMSYTNNYIQYFSNPALTYNGEAVGVAEGDTHPANCSRTIRETKFIMAINDNVDEINEAGDTLNLTDMSGEILDLNDRDSFKMNLGGVTTFTLASQGYSAPYFFLNLYKNGNYLITTFEDASKTLTLENGEYTVVLSLVNDSTGGYYPSSSRSYSVATTSNYVAPIVNNTFNPSIINYLLF